MLAQSMSSPARVPHGNVQKAQKLENRRISQGAQHVLHASIRTRTQSRLGFAGGHPICVHTSVFVILVRRELLLSRKLGRTAKHHVAHKSNKSVSVLHADALPSQDAVALLVPKRCSESRSRLEE